MAARTVSVIALIVLAFLFSGCASSTAGKIGMLDNRVSCTLDGKHMLFSSMYGPVGITAKVEEADGKVICSKPNATSSN